MIRDHGVQNQGQKRATRSRVPMANPLYGYIRPAALHESQFMAGPAEASKTARGRGQAGCRPILESATRAMPRACGRRRPPAPPPLPRRHVLAGLPHAVGTARGDHPLRPVYGRAGEPRHQRPVPQVSLGRRLCASPHRRAGKRHPKHRILSQQGQEHPELLPAAGRAVRRPGAAEHRATGRIAGHRPEDGQRDPRHGVWHRLGRRGGHSRNASQPPPGTFAAERRRENREGSHGGDSQQGMGRIQPPHDPARKEDLRGTQAQVRCLPVERDLPQGGRRVGQTNSRV